MPTLKLYDELPAPNTAEILRYAGMRGATDEVSNLVDTCLNLCEGQLAGRVCYEEFPVSATVDGLDLGFAVTESKDLARHLEGCHRVILMAATVGLGIDRLITKYAKLSPAKALVLQAIGAERIEALCDLFCEDLQAEYGNRGLALTGRFSPGYGDLPLALQRKVFAALNCEKHMGLTLNDSLLMAPSKSVTALMGVAQADTRKAFTTCGACELCGNLDCTFRKID